MTILLAGGLITLIALAFLAWPFFRKDAGSEPEAREIAIYQDQLAEVDRDLSRAVLSEEQAAAAKTEIERRLLGALKRREAQKEARVSRAGRLAVIASLAAIPLAAALLYLSIGSPDGPASPVPAVSATQAAEQLAANERHPELARQIAELEARLATERDDVDGFVLLARTLARIGDYDRALAAYGEVTRLTGGGDAQLAGEMAEVMVLGNDGIVTPDAHEIFRLISEDFPDDPQSAYYLALAKAQGGDVEGGVADLIALRDRSPGDAPWLPAVNGLIAQLAPGRKADTPEDRRFAGPTAQEMAAAQEMTPEARQEMIEGMVAGLAAKLEEDPDDLDGWKRLARAYQVLGRDEDAARAHGEVLKRDPDDPAAKAFLEGR